MTAAVVVVAGTVVTTGLSLWAVGAVTRILVKQQDQR
jgi:hypothetical protein